MNFKQQKSILTILGPAKQMQTQYLPQIEQNAGQIMALMRGSRA
jgi:hypothetical protein